MSFVPQPCDSDSGECCPTVFVGFCLEDGTPISIHFQGSVQTGWTNLETGVFTAGPPPVGTVTCSSGSSNFSYPEDSPHVSGDIGAFILAVRNDAGTALAADGDYSPLQVNAAGELRVTTTGGTPTGRDDTDNQAAVATGLNTTVNRAYIWDGATWDRWTGAVTGPLTDAQLRATPVPISGTVSVVEPVSVDDNGGSLTVDGAVTIINAGGAAAVNIQDGGNSITVDGTVTSDTNFDYPEDSGHVSGDVGAFILAVRNDTGAGRTNADGDYSPISVDSAGRQNVVGAVAEGGTASGNPVRIAGSDGSSLIKTLLTDGAGRLTVIGAAADGSAVTSNPVLMAGQDGGSVQSLLTDTAGRLITIGAGGILDPQKVEDTPHVTGDVGSFILGVRNDAAAPLTSADGDYTPFATDSAGRIGVSDLGGSITIDGTVSVTEPVTVDAVDLDIRNLLFATDKVDVSGSSVTVSGTVSVTEPVTVDAVDFDIRNLVFATDKVDVSGSSVTVGQPTGTITNGSETAVSGAAVTILAANIARKKYIVQNVGAANIRVGVAGVTATTGLRLTPNGTVLMEMPHCPTDALFAIRETAVDSIAFAQEVT